MLKEEYMAFILGIAIGRKESWSACEMVKGNLDDLS